MPRLTLAEKLSAIERHRKAALELFRGSVFELSLVAATFGYRLMLEPMMKAGAKKEGVRPKRATPEQKAEVMRMANEGVPYVQIFKKLKLRNVKQVQNIVYAEKKKG